MVDRKVMVVDDEKANLDLISAVLADDGFECACYDNASAAKVAFDAVKPFMLITDLRLTRNHIDGVTLAEQLHRRDTFLICVAISGFFDAFEFGYCLGTVFTDCLSKPFRVEDLKRIVSYGWEKRQRWESILV
jgi:DNA-binding NtrC family response regulator